MILGTYWYFDFPTDLYKFEYFEFRKGYGGHADNPAELVANIVSENPEKIISELRLLIKLYDEGFLFVYQDGHKLKIGTGAHQLYDYDFLIIAEVEKILRKEQIIIAKEQKLDNPIFLRITKENSLKNIIYPTKNILQIVGSELKKHNAENLKFRLDCNLSLDDKFNFIKELKIISKEENINVLFYYHKEFENKVNLMVFFTNGRQGLNLSNKQIVNSSNFENKIELAMLKSNVKCGHINGIDLYPQNGPKIEMIIEEEIVI